MRVLFGEGVPEVFQDLPPAVQRKATEIINLLAVFPEMYPERQRGLMTGYRYFTVKSICSTIRFRQKSCASPPSFPAACGSPDSRSRRRIRQIRATRDRHERRFLFLVGAGALEEQVVSGDSAKRN